MNLMTNTSAPSFVTSTSNRVWVIDDDVALRTILQDALTDAGFEVQTFGQLVPIYAVAEIPQGSL